MFDDAFGAFYGPPTAPDYESRRAVVPEVDMKLGLMYTKSLTSGQWSIDARYLWAHYQKNLVATEGPYRAYQHFQPMIYH